MTEAFRIRRTDHGDGTAVFRAQVKIFWIWWEDIGFHYKGEQSYVGPGSTLQDAEDTLKYCLKKAREKRLKNHKTHTIITEVEV